jgi:uncharacterized membrane protein YfcA
MKSGFLTGLAGAGWIFFLALALLPGLNAIYPTSAWFAMAGCALGAWLCGSRTQKAVAVLGLLIGLAGGVYCWEKNAPIYQHMREHSRSAQSPPQ